MDVTLKGGVCNEMLPRMDFEIWQDEDPEDFVDSSVI